MPVSFGNAHVPLLVTLITLLLALLNGYLKGCLKRERNVTEMQPQCD
jgi:hypothetical protein